MPPLTSIITVTFNSQSCIEDCIEQIVEQTTVPWELIVVDNCSTDGTAQFLKTKIYNYLPKERYQFILNQENKGFSKAANQGVRLARGQYICFLNNDVIVTKGWLRKLQDHLNNDPGAGMVGPMGSGLGGWQDYCRYYGSLGSTTVDKQTIQSTARQVYAQYRGDYTETKFLIGACLLVKKEVLEHIGLMDENLFLGGNEFDLSLRARMAGYKLYAAEDVFVHHIGQVSFKTLPVETREAYSKQSWDYFNGKWNKLLKEYFKDRVPSWDDLFVNKKPILYSGLIKGRRTKISNW